MKARILAMCVSSAVALAASSALAAPSAWWAPYSTDANTIGLWHFNDVTGPTGPIADSSGNGNNGTLTVNAIGSPPVNVTLTTPGVSGAGTGPGTGLFGKSLDFSPSSLPLPTDASALSWGSVPNGSGQLSFGSALTVEAWIKPVARDVNPTTPGEVYFLGDRGTDGWTLGFLQGKLFFDAKGSNGNDYSYAWANSASITAGNWYHVAAVYDSAASSIKLYIDGAEAPSTMVYAGPIDDTGALDLQFGNRGTATAYTVFNGDLDEVRLSNVARTFGEAPVPEPASIALFGAIVTMALVRRRRR